MPMGALAATASAAHAAQPADASATVIVGAGRDLSERLVVPAPENLMAGRPLPHEFVLIGVDIAALSTERWRQPLSEMMHSLLRSGGRAWRAIDHYL